MQNAKCKHELFAALAWLGFRRAVQPDAANMWRLHFEFCILN
jgi:hypothetical protein